MQLFDIKRPISEYHPYRTAFVDNVVFILEDCEQLHKDIAEWANRYTPDNHETYVFFGGFAITFSDCKAYIGTGVFIKEWP